MNTEAWADDLVAMAKLRWGDFRAVGDVPSGLELGGKTVAFALR